MKKYFKSFLLLFTVLLIILSCTVVYAHPGRTDSSGGHNDYAAGDYHYHEGHEAHYHPDGTCPYGYDVDETTKHITTETYSSKTTTRKSYTQTTTRKNYRATTSRENYRATTQAASTQAAQKSPAVTGSSNTDTDDETLVLSLIIAICVIATVVICVCIDKREKKINEEIVKERSKAERKKQAERKIRSNYTQKLNGNVSELKRTGNNVKSEARNILEDKISDVKEKENNLKVETSTVISTSLQELEIEKSAFYNFFDDYCNALFVQLDADISNRKEILTSVQFLKDLYPEKYYTLYFYRQNLNELAKVDKGYSFFGKDLYRTANGKFIPDGLILYVSATGKKYHLERGCHRAYKAVNVITQHNMLISLEPCFDCCGHHFPFDVDFWLYEKKHWYDWYDKYLKLYELKVKYYKYQNAEEIPTKLVNVTRNSLYISEHNRQYFLNKMSMVFDIENLPLDLLPYRNDKGEDVFLAIANLRIDGSRKDVDLGEIKHKRSKQIYESLGKGKDVFITLSEITGLDKEYNLGCNIKIISKW